MSNFRPILVLAQTCDQVLSWVRQQLTGVGLRVTQTFDLQVARLAHPDCPCPHHGMDDCNCQMVVLLVYQKQDDPATLVVHGLGGKSWVSLAGPAGKRFNQHLETVVRRALIPHLTNAPSSTEVPYDTQPTV
jgi:hypothetical protein